MSTRTGAVVFAMLLLVGACSGGRRAVEGEAEKRTIGTLNSIPDPLPPGPPGSLIREERLLGAPGGAIARPAPRDGWLVVSWAHPTTGAYGDCAPSVGSRPFPAHRRRARVVERGLRHRRPRLPRDGGGRSAELSDRGERSEQRPRRCPRPSGRAREQQGRPLGSLTRRAATTTKLTRRV